MSAGRPHEVAVAWIHVVAGLFVFGCVSMLWISAAQLAPTFAGTFVPELIAWIGRPVATFFLVISGGEIVGAIALLRRRAWSRVPLFGVSILLLAIFPIGTAIAVYTFWALSRDAPAGQRP